MRRTGRLVLVVAMLLALNVPGGSTSVQGAASYPSLLFNSTELDAIRARAASERMAPVRTRLLARANALLTAAPLLVSTTGRGQSDPPGTLKGLEAARRLQGRVLTFSMAFLLTGDMRYRDAAVAQLDHAITNWPIWVDTAHPPPYDLMEGEISLTFGLAFDWLHDSLTADERGRLRDGVERRAMRPYLDAVDVAKPMSWYHADHNWNPVCNGGAAVLALALRDESSLAERVLRLAVPAMAYYWNNLGDDGGWEEGTGYWTYGHRYAFMAADALRRAGVAAGADYLAREGARQTGMFPLVFNPGTRISASFSDSSGRANDPVLYFLGREYRNPDYVWFEDRTAPRSITSEGWPDEVLTLLWRDVDDSWLPEARPSFLPAIPATAAFPSIGWAMLASEQPDPPLFLAFKNGSTAANHSHLDLNHVTVGMGDNLVLIDLGSRPYTADYFTNPARQNYYEISTAGHNSVLIGGRGQVFGKDGTLSGPVAGSNYSAFVGEAAASYQVATRRARRYAAFVDRRYYVLLDEVIPQSPAAVELRFHSYGTMTPWPQRTGWTVNQSGSALDVVPADPTLVTGSVESPTGWTRAVNLLRLASGQSVGSLVLATAIIPRGSAATYPVVSQEISGNELRVHIDGDEIVFRQGADGYVLARVTTVPRL